MKSISLIQAIVLLHEKERLKKKPIKLKNRKIHRIEATSQNLAVARKLAHMALGRNLRDLPRQTKILFLLIETMEEKWRKQGIGKHSAVRFSRKNIRLETGWSDTQISLHLNRLETLHYLLKHRDKYELIHKSKSVTTLVLDRTV